MSKPVWWNFSSPPFVFILVTLSSLLSKKFDDYLKSISYANFISTQSPKRRWFSVMESEIDPASVLRIKTRKQESERKRYAGVNAIYYLHPVISLTFLRLKHQPRCASPIGAARCGETLFIFSSRSCTHVVMFADLTHQPTISLIYLLPQVMETNHRCWTPTGRRRNSRRMINANR